METTTDRFEKPTAMNAITAAFGGGSMRDLMPDYKDIPEEFRRGHTKWNKFQREWFFGGIDATGLIPKDGIDKAVAIRHLAAINGSFDPKHEHKEAGVAYLASKWFKPESTWTAKTPEK